MHVFANWDAVAPEYQVTSYKIYHGKSADSLQYFTDIASPGITLYTDQMGYVPGEMFFAAASAVNATGEGPKTVVASVRLPVALPLPPAPDNFTLTLLP